MFSMTKSRELDEVLRQDAEVNKRYYGGDVKLYPMIYIVLHTIVFSISFFHIRIKEC